MYFMDDGDGDWFVLIMQQNWIKIFFKIESEKKIQFYFLDLLSYPPFFNPSSFHYTPKC